MSSIDYDTFRREVTLAAVLGSLGWEPTLIRGDERRGRCPVCLRCGRQPSFSADLRAGKWYCHRCKRGGGQLELVQAVYRLPFFETVKELCLVLGKPVPYLPRSKVRRPRKPRPPRNGEES